MKYYKFNVVSASNDKTKKPKFTTTPRKVETKAIKKSNTKKTEQVVDDISE